MCRLRPCSILLTQGGSTQVGQLQTSKAFEASHPSLNNSACAQELELKVDAGSLTELLKFLTHGFGGGTDVDRPLELSLERLEQKEWAQVGRHPGILEHVRLHRASSLMPLRACIHQHPKWHPAERVLLCDIENFYMQADIMMVTDGEIAPPAQDVLNRLDRAKAEEGLEVHGLLVGRCGRQLPQS